jgi:hypothetical protein
MGKPLRKRKRGAAWLRVGIEMPGALRYHAEAAASWGGVVVVMVVVVPIMCSMLGDKLAQEEADCQIAVFSRRP